MLRKEQVDKTYGRRGSMLHMAYDLRTYHNLGSLDTLTCFTYYLAALYARTLEDIPNGSFHRGLPHESTVRGVQGFVRVP